VRTAEVAAGGEARVDWRVRAIAAGEAVARMKGLTDEESDAVELRIPVHVHGMLQTAAWSGSIPPDGTATTLTVDVLAERRPERTRLQLRYAHSLAAALVDALPYLADYPYGCTEQTLNRFLPSIIAQKTLRDLGLDLKALGRRRAGARDARGSAGEAPRHGPLVDPEAPRRNPIFDPDEVTAMVRAGLVRLSEMRTDDGGWGWLSAEGGHATPDLTAMVVHGLRIASSTDLDIPPSFLEEGIAWLKAHQANQVRLLKRGGIGPLRGKAHADETDAHVFLVLTECCIKDEHMMQFLERDRARLAVHGRVMIGLAFHSLGEKDRLGRVRKDIERFLVRDDEDQTASLRTPGEGTGRSWFGSGIEANASFLKLLARTDPKGETASRLARYLVNRRRHATYWDSTRDTACCVEALAEYLRASGEDRPEMTVEILVDGVARERARFTPDDLLAPGGTLVLEGDALAPGLHAVEFRKSGRGPLYVNAYLSWSTRQDPIRGSGEAITVDRKLYKLTKQEGGAPVAGARGAAIGRDVPERRREALDDGATLTSGDRVEVELTIECKDDYEYILIEDGKGAGFEAAGVPGGYDGNGLGAYVERRDDRVAFLVPRLPRGRHKLSYRLRAEIPGTFGVLPARASAMYAPELRSNSAEFKIKISD
jgi:hypothetical protein